MTTKVGDLEGLISREVQDKYFNKFSKLGVKRSLKIFLERDGNLKFIGGTKFIQKYFFISERFITLAYKLLQMVAKIDLTTKKRFIESPERKGLDGLPICRKYLRLNFPETLLKLWLGRQSSEERNYVFLESLSGTIR